MKKIFLIGGTGFIGKQIVKQLLTEQVEILLLVRFKSKAISLFQESEHLHENSLQYVEGDLTKKGLGLSEKDKQRVLKSDVIIHAGGPMDITVSEQKATSAFLNGARHVGELAKSIHEAKGLQQFIHVVGYMSPFNDDNSNINIDVFQEGHQFLKIKNPYERTKFLADLYIRQQAKEVGYPLSVINPPTVVGSSLTGSTEQVAGLGLLVNSMRKGVMPVVPGGKHYRLPLIANNVLAEFIVKILNEEHPKSSTYTLVPDQKADLSMPELLNIMAESMNVNAPTRSVPMQILKALMNVGVSKITGIPADGLNFITKRNFTNDMVIKVMGKHWFQETSATNFLPVVIADLDYRLTSPDRQQDNKFDRVRIGNLVVYQKDGVGKPYILFHGLLSDGEDLFPLGIHLHEKTGRPVWVVDLPGFGRSPFQKGENLMASYISAVNNILSQANEGSHFIGHSFGAFVLFAAFKEKYFRPQDNITLLQPPLVRKDVTKLPTFAKKWVLKKTSIKRFEDYILDTGLFGRVDQIPPNYITKVKNSFSSPRILNTTLMVDGLLSQMDKTEMMDGKGNYFQIIWGNQDKAYQLPKSFENITQVPYGHHFPLSHPKETAQIILKD